MHEISRPSVQFSVQSFSHVWLFVTPWTAACQVSLSTTKSRSLLKLVSVESVMPSNHLILCRPPLLPSVFPSIRLFSNELVLHIKRPRYWSFSFIISPSSEYPGLICMNGIMQYKVFYASFTQRNVFEGHHIKMCLSIFFLFIPAGVPWYTTCGLWTCVLFAG